ncbi:hypothetical protein Nhal_0384 [Nitrosococcus halophilus Nc 4]|uniref:Methyltransferase type 11 n=1 Tax=Nitrosococcus halophilus (strain Nc4) TaxID=472759 RepID=D5BVE9_NITHN|nr:methyltransferase domain-containing protein [Nitrosococcus halophilus]ADE13577.1 hypothetical protein Nhal_0384 [Nitrosococcus halophilus Nc 4]
MDENIQNQKYAPSVQYDGFNYVLSDEFQKNSKIETENWDKEWMRYFSLGKDYSFYYYDMDTNNYALSVSPSKISEFSPEQTYHAKFFREIKGRVWAYGSDLVDRDILEMGCGPGIFGRISGRFAKSYTGIDISLFALYIARLTSPKKKCNYHHLYDPSSIKHLSKRFDTSFGRNFFIHHNYNDSLWILRFLRDLTKSGGVIIADFHCEPALVDGHRRVMAADSLRKNYPSALFNFMDNDIDKISQEAHLTLEAIDYVPEEACRFARLRV